MTNPVLAVLALSLSAWVPWTPTSVSPALVEELRVQFRTDYVDQLPRELKPREGVETDCFMAGFLSVAAGRVLLGAYVRGELGAAYAVEAAKIQQEAADFHDRNCRGPDSPSGKEEMAIAYMLVKSMPQGAARTAQPPFRLPAMVGRDDRDLAVVVETMLWQLEASLSDGGVRLSAAGRACAWATAAAAATGSVIRRGGGTASIAAADGALAWRRASCCSGAALAEQRAAWAWLRAHPRATQALQVPLRMTVGVWPTPGRTEPLAWLAVVLAVLVPELLPLVGVAGAR